MVKTVNANLLRPVPKCLTRKLVKKMAVNGVTARVKGIGTDTVLLMGMSVIARKKRPLMSPSATPIREKNLVSRMVVIGVRAQTLVGVNPRRVSVIANEEKEKSKEKNMNNTVNNWFSYSIKTYHLIEI